MQEYYTTMPGIIFFMLTFPCNKIVNYVSQTTFWFYFVSLLRSSVVNGRLRNSSCFFLSQSSMEYLLMLIVLFFSFIKWLRYIVSMKCLPSNDLAVFSSFYYYFFLLWISWQHLFELLWISWILLSSFNISISFFCPQLLAKTWEY